MLNFFEFSFKNLDETEWVVSRERYKFDEMFQELQPVDGKITSLFLNFIFLIIKGPSKHFLNFLSLDRACLIFIFKK